MAKVGEPAPQFELQCVNSDGERLVIGSNHLRGSWTALLFYPRDFSFICPTEIIAVSSRIEEFHEKNCNVLGISIDDLETHIKWFNTPDADGGVGKLRYPLAADIDGVVSKKFGIWSERSELAHRALFLIDPDGIIQFSVVHGPKVGRNVDEILRVLDALSSGGLCPASWTSADGTLNVEELLKPGRTLGHYRIERELGSGAFGSVVEAVDLRLKRPVAVKILRDNRGSTARRQLLAEARGGARVTHPNVCTVFSVDEIDGLPVIVMELLDGKPLTEMKDELRDLQSRLTLLRKLAGGLAAAHSVDVVHGDLKPANVIVVDQRPVIVDFGLSFSTNESLLDFVEGNTATDGDSLMPASERASSRVEVGETVGATTIFTPDSAAGLQTTDAWIPGDDDSFQKRRTVAGTFAYMAPEILRGNRKDQRSDIFSLGVIFLELISGRSNLLGDNIGEIAANLQRADVASYLCSDPDLPMVETVRKMLSSDPNERPAATEIERQISAI